MNLALKPFYNLYKGLKCMLIMSFLIKRLVLFRKLHIAYWSIHPSILASHSVFLWIHVNFYRPTGIISDWQSVRSSKCTTGIIGCLFFVLYFYFLAALYGCLIYSVNWNQKKKKFLKALKTYFWTLVKPCYSHRSRNYFVCNFG